MGARCEQVWRGVAGFSTNIKLFLLRILGQFTAYFTRSQMVRSIFRPKYHWNERKEREKNNHRLNTNQHTADTRVCLVFSVWAVLDRAVSTPDAQCKYLSLFAMKRRALEWQRKLDLSHRSFAMEENKNLSFLKRCVIKLNHNRSDYHYQTDWWKRRCFGRTVFGFFCSPGALPTNRHTHTQT